MVKIKEYEAHVEQMKIEGKRVDGEEKRKYLEQESQIAKSKSEYQVWSSVLCCQPVLQRFSSSLSQGFKDEDLGNSPGWWATIVANYCPSRLSQLLTTKHCDRLNE